MDKTYRTLPSPIGTLTVVEAGDGSLFEVLFDGQAPPKDAIHNANAASEAAKQLTEYFDGKRRDFNLKLSPKGTEFQRAVWNELLAIPYGQTRSYLQIAVSLGKPTATRAVGAANGANPIPIIVPCHRVIGADGSLTGFGGGLDIKRKLLELEGLLSPALL
jgi:methylated-DNA-[protein]-cysteine S-methyltransferase